VALEVRLGSKAARRLDELPRQRRGRTILALRELARRPPRDGLLDVWTSNDVAALEVWSEIKLMLVYAVVDTRDLQGTLLGPEVLRRFDAREGRRTMRQPISRR
jgi:hypothetical protein